jgi:hypothetical protein
LAGPHVWSSRWYTRKRAMITPVHRIVRDAKFAAA